jgi:[protein-PII] uridylyltransferase
MMSINRGRLAVPRSGRISSEDLARFCISMPSPYRLEYSDEEIREHAAIVERRGGSLAHVEPLLHTSRAGQWLCIVTDDRPGLLSLLSAALSAHSLDILTAKVYCRLRPGSLAEAVDFFGVRAVRSEVDLELTAGLLSSLENSIEALLRGELSVDALEKRAAPSARPRRQSPATAYFDDAADADILIVQALDHPGLLLKITLTLFREGLTVRRSNVATLGHLARDEFELSEIDGSPLTDARKTSVIRGVMATLSRKGE